MDRRTFFSGLAAAALGPTLAKAASVPHGFIWEGDWLVLRNQTIILDGPLDLSGLAGKILIDHCTFEMPIGSNVLNCSNSYDQLFVRDCTFNLTGYFYFSDYWLVCLSAP